MSLKERMTRVVELGQLHGHSAATVISRLMEELSAPDQDACFRGGSTYLGDLEIRQPCVAHLSIGADNARSVWRAMLGIDQPKRWSGRAFSPIEPIP